MPARLSDPCPRCWRQLPSLKKLQILAVLNIVFFVATLAVNGTVGGKIGDVSRENDVILKLAGFAFSIWGIIYAWTAVFLVWQAVVAFNLCKRMEKPKDASPEEHQHAQTGGASGPQADHVSSTQRTLLDGVSVWFIMSCIFNMLWILTFTTGTTGGIIASTFLLVALAASLLVAHLQVGKFLWRGRLDGHMKSVRHEHVPPAYELLLLDVPLSIYLGWACSASLVNLTITLQKVFGWTWLASEEDNPAATFAFVLLVAATLVFWLVSLPPRGCQVLAVLPESMKQLFTLCQGNFVAGFVYLWATLALFTELQLSSGPCLSGKLEGVSDIPKVCENVATTALSTGILVVVTSVYSLRSLAIVVIDGQAR